MVARPKKKLRRASVAAVGAGTVGVLVRRRRQERLRNAATGMRETLSPRGVTDEPFLTPEHGDEAHAPGHQHLGPAPSPSALTRTRRAIGTWMRPGVPPKRL
jgi:hypothetical protein